MYHSNIHSEHGSSSNQSSRSGHHEWLSSIILSSGEGAFADISFILSPLGGASSNLLAGTSSNGGSLGSCWIFIDASAIQECFDTVSICVTNSVFPKSSGSRFLCASVDHCFVVDSGSIVALGLSLCNCISGSAASCGELVCASKEVLSNWARSVRGCRNISACSARCLVFVPCCDTTNSYGCATVSGNWGSCFQWWCNQYCFACCIRVLNKVILGFTGNSAGGGVSDCSSTISLSPIECGEISCIFVCSSWLAINLDWWGKSFTLWLSQVILVGSWAGCNTVWCSAVEEWRGAGSSSFNGDAISSGESGMKLSVYTTTSSG